MDATPRAHSSLLCFPTDDVLACSRNEPPAISSQRSANFLAHSRDPARVMVAETSNDGELLLPGSPLPVLSEIVPPQPRSLECDPDTVSHWKTVEVYLVSCRRLVDHGLICIALCGPDDFALFPSALGEHECGSSVVPATRPSPTCRRKLLRYYTSCLGGECWRRSGHLATHLTLWRHHLPLARLDSRGIGRRYRSLGDIASTGYYAWQ